MSANEPKSNDEIKHKALLVGVSDYPAPYTKLPGVANDVPAMAKELSSKYGVFSAKSVTLLMNKQASREAVLSNLRAVFTGAHEDETIFVYMSGHGTRDDGGYYYLAHDTNLDDVEETGVPLAEIKSLLDQTPSQRAFLWLDFCHSGGVVARGPARANSSLVSGDILGVTGHGKIIIAACTSDQIAYEDEAIGHGLFTHALLRGLRGEAMREASEVTATSLYEFINREVANPEQQPLFSGVMTGKIVLMRYPDADWKQIEKDAVTVEQLRQSGGDWIAHLRSVAKAGIDRWNSGVKTGISEAYWLNGLLWENGINTPNQEANLATARKLFDTAASKGYANAQYELALYCKYGLGGEKPDTGRAMTLLEQAAKQGHRDAMYEFGLACLESQGKDRASREAAIYWLKQAAEKGHADAWYQLGDLLSQGTKSDLQQFESSNIPKEQ